MSHIKTRKLIEGRTEFAGRKWWYQFEQIPEHCSAENTAKYSQKLSQHFSRLTRKWNSELNSEWTVRIYFAAKMVLAASVMAQSLKFATEKNLRSVCSYLHYYTAMHSLRAIMLTNPHVEWNDGEILQATHSKTINIATDAIAHFDRKLSEYVRKSVIHLKAFRELISYRAPSSGDNFQKPDFDTFSYCRLFLEIAQLQSELLEASIEKHVTQQFELEQEFTQYVTDVEIDGILFQDNEDWYRIGYLARKHPSPTNILHIMSEGHVEDFFGSWRADDEQPDAFDPDEDWRILFDVP